MKKTTALILSLLMFAGMILTCGCSHENVREGNSQNYYTLEDFESIVVGKSNHTDVYIIAPTATMQCTSYGGKCEYMMENGNLICIKFYGEELIVGSIEIIEAP